MDCLPQIIPIAVGWYREFYPGFSCIPNDRMLIELLRPGTDPNTAVIQESEHSEIPDLKSQSILQEWSNHWISKIHSDVITDDNPKGLDDFSRLIIQNGTDKKMDCKYILYHLNVCRYINRLFPDKLLPSSKKTKKLFNQLSGSYFYG